MAQYPNKPVRLIVPFIAGSAPDMLARNVGERLGAKLGQPIVIENKGGAGGNVGAKRNPLLPDVPTLLEAIPNGFDIEAWFDV